MAIRWKRASDGFVESHDGLWQITPCHAGCTRPQDYVLWRDGVRVASMIATQREAKEVANDLADRDRAREEQASRRARRHAAAYYCDDHRPPEDTK